LNAKKKGEAIGCFSCDGPHFQDIRVSNLCNATTNYSHYFGGSYVNNTGLDGRTFLTGSRSFYVKEIEVFEITN
jgi:hypothetical protein